MSNASSSGGDSRPSDLYRAACVYVREWGWKVFPVSSQDKSPLVPHGYKDASQDEVRLRHWFQDWFPTHGIGVPTGIVNGFVVLDVDPRNGGEASLQELTREFGLLPSGPTVRTGGGGYHYYFSPVGQWIRSVTGVRPGIDVKAEGGYVIAPPSLHPSGKRYEWELRWDETDLPPIPNWLLELTHSSPSARGEAGKEPPKFPVEEGKIPIGYRHNWIVSTAAAMAVRLPDASEEDLIRLLTAMAHAAMETDARTDTDIVEAVRSAIRKRTNWGKSETPVNRPTGGSTLDPKRYPPAGRTVAEVDWWIRA